MTYGGGKERRKFDPTHPGIVWNRTVLYHQKPGLVWNSRSANGYRLSRLQRAKFVDKIVRDALKDQGYREYIDHVCKAYSEWLVVQCPEDQVSDYLEANVRITEHELMASISKGRTIH